MPKFGQFTPGLRPGPTLATPPSQVWTAWYLVEQNNERRADSEGAAYPAGTVTNEDGTAAMNEDGTFTIEESA